MSTFSAKALSCKSCSIISTLTMTAMPLPQRAVRGLYRPRGHNVQTTPLNRVGQRLYNRVNNEINSFTEQHIHPPRSYSLSSSTTSQISHFVISAHTHYIHSLISSIRRAGPRRSQAHRHTHTARTARAPAAPPTTAPPQRRVVGSEVPSTFNMMLPDR